MVRLLRPAIVLSALAAVALAVPPLQLSTPAATAQVGVLYNSSCAATNGTAPYQYNVTSGALPGGLTLNQSTCAITGTPNAVGVFTFTVQGFDVNSLGSNTPAGQALRGTKQAGSPGLSGSSSFTITVSPAAAATGAPALTEFALFGLAAAMAAMGAMLLRRRSA